MQPVSAYYRIYHISAKVIKPRITAREYAKYHHGSRQAFKSYISKALKREASDLTFESISKKNTIHLAYSRKNAIKESVA